MRRRNNSKVKTESLHETAIDSLLEMNPDIHRNGFWIAARELWDRLCGNEEDDLCEEFPKRGFLPDAYMIQESRKTLVLFEVEDTHPLSHSKRALMGSFWFAWDCTSFDWDVEFVMVNRFGMITHKLKGIDLYLEAIGQEAHENRVARKLQAV